MKTLILSFILILGITATNHGKPITTIYSFIEPAFPQEAYVNDIPFNTWEIAVEALMEGDEVQLEDEPYVDDIPFDTRKIACLCILRKMIEATSEVNIDDIPFNTERIFYELIAGRLTADFRNEKPDISKIQSTKMEELELEAAIDTKPPEIFVKPGFSL